MSTQDVQLARGKRTLFMFFVVGMASCAALGIAEVFLRIVPVPGIGFHTFYYNDLTGGRYYPGTTVVYRNARGEHVRRRVNSLGFLDIEHERAKPAGTIRVGFFGDSYTEAQQVELTDTFFRRAQSALNAREGNPPGNKKYECFSFGMSGYSTLQSYLECRNWMDVFDLDEIVYVFVENDPGDQIRAIKRLALERWFTDTSREGRRISVLYIPLDREMHKPYEMQDSWAAWLAEICSENGVELIDPSQRFVEAKAAGKEIFYDHLTPDGHEVLADVFVGAFLR